MNDTEKLAIIRARLVRLGRIINPADPVADAFPLGRVGGSGPNVASLNARRAASLERTIDASVEYQKLQDEEARLVRRIEAASPDAQVAQTKKADAIAAATTLAERAAGGGDAGDWGSAGVRVMNICSECGGYDLAAHEVVTYADCTVDRNPIAKEATMSSVPKLHTFYDSHGELWQICSPDAIGAEAFGPRYTAKRFSGPTYTEAKKAGRIYECADGWAWLVDGEDRALLDALDEIARLRSWVAWLCGATAKIGGVNPNVLARHILDGAQPFVRPDTVGAPTSPASAGGAT